MQAATAISGLIRGLLSAAITAAAVFGLLAMFHPFDNPIAPSLADPDVLGLQQQIGVLRAALRDNETALDNVNAQSVHVAPVDPGQTDAQLAATTERRDVALRQAAAIRDALKSGASVASLAGIRDSVVIGQLLAQQTALDTQIAEDGARLKPTHPTMQALAAQRTALLAAIDAEAANIAAALESEARLDDAQISLLRAHTLPASDAAQPAADTLNLAAKIASQRTELDTLLDAYFKLKPASAADAASAATPLSPLNMLIVGVAAFAAVAFHLLLASQRARARRAARDLAAWRRDIESEPAAPAQAAPAAPAPLRRAS